MVIRKLLIDRRSLDDRLTGRVTAALGGVPVETGGPFQPPYDGIEAAAGTLVLTRHPGSFVKDFPATPGAPPCGEKYVITMLNCPFSCTYCYLQSYLEHGHIVVFTNTGRMKDEIASAIGEEGPPRITTGEFGDSLALDHITGTVFELLPLFAGSGTVLEARTKSGAIAHLLAAAPGNEALRRDLVLTWTLAGQEAVETEEHGTAGLDLRIAAAAEASDAGMRTAVRFDPVIPSYFDPGEYRGLIERLWSSGARPERFEVGALRFPPGLWELVRGRHRDSRLLRGEYFTDSEGKRRSYRPERIRM